MTESMRRDAVMTAPVTRAWLRLVALLGLVGLLVGCSASSGQVSTSAIDVWSSGPGWHTSAVQSFPGAETPTLNALACTSPSQCDAVGTYVVGPGKGIMPFVLTGLTSGNRPVLVRLQMPAGTEVTYTAELACTSPGYCAVVGTYSALHGASLSNGFTATESGGHWSAARTSAPPPGSQGIQDLSGVTCTSPGSCVAVGSALTSTDVQVPIVLTESKGTWGRAAYISPPADFNADQPSNLLSVACAGPGSCVAVGQYPVKSGLVQWPMAVVESGGHWLSARKIPLPADANQDPKAGAGSLSAVSCAPGGTCLAVGGYAAGAAGTDRGLAITESNGRFGQVAARPQELSTVTCVPGACVTGNRVGAMSSYTVSPADGHWSQLGSVQPPASVVKGAPHGSSLSAAHVVCFADDRCVVVSTFSGTSRPAVILVSTHASISTS